jgi:peptidoglycan/LPS O-acetylase OafA/YrhL
LDLLRGVAALLVCAGHLRAFIFIDFAHVASPNTFDRLFYFATGLGHQAVVVFFVLSGYLVGGSVLNAYQSGRWSWKNYTLRRLSRLWTVLLPALAFTFVLDNLGRSWGASGYDGAWYSLYCSGPTPAAPTDLRAITCVGNAVFLQTIEVNCFGTNGPLWSLANEFWYYVLFPVIIGAAVARSIPIRVFYFLLAISFVCWLPVGIVWSGLIWLFGVAAFLIARTEVGRKICSHPTWLAATGAVALCSLVTNKTTRVLNEDWIVGIAFAVLVAGLASYEHHVSWLKRLSSALSDLSYTLYLIHFPLLSFVFFSFFHGRRFPPDTASYFIFGLLLTGTIAVAAMMWWCFERNTDRLRESIEHIVFAKGTSIAKGKHLQV